MHNIWDKVLKTAKTAISTNVVKTKDNDADQLGKLVNKLQTEKKAKINNQSNIIEQ